MKLRVDAPGDIYTLDYGAINQKFLELISENLNHASLYEWFLPGFSTTTETDRVCAASMSMCALQEYFDYWIMICGIPQITLLGTIEDWKLLRAKVNRLLEFDDQQKVRSTHWVPVLQEILDNFVLSTEKGSEENLDFWDSVVFHSSGVINPCVTAPIGPERDYMSGWITGFSFFGEDGKVIADPSTAHGGPWPKLRHYNFYHNIASCPVTIALSENEIVANATLFVGQMAYDYVVDMEATNNPPLAVRNPVNENATMRILKPRSDWAMSIAQGFVSYEERYIDSSLALDEESLLRGTSFGMCSYDYTAPGNWTPVDPSELMATHYPSTDPDTRSLGEELTTQSPSETVQLQALTVSLSDTKTRSDRILAATVMISLAAALPLVMAALLRWHERLSHSHKTLANDKKAGPNSFPTCKEEPLV